MNHTFEYPGEVELLPFPSFILRFTLNSLMAGRKLQTENRPPNASFFYAFPYVQTVLRLLLRQTGSLTDPRRSYSKQQRLLIFPVTFLHACLFVSSFPSNQGGHLIINSNKTLRNQQHAPIHFNK